METSPELATALGRVAFCETFPDGTPGRFLSGADAARLAAEFGLLAREVDMAALAAGIVPRRYARNFTQFTKDEQIRLLSSRAAMVGLGGLGGYVLEVLARMGVGTVRCADGDVFEESNLNRQLLSGISALSRPKADLAMERAMEINPSVDVIASTDFLDEPGMRRLLEGTQVTVDALGGLADRPVLARAAAEMGIPLVTGAVAGMTGVVSVVLPGDAGLRDFFASKGGGAEDSLGCPAAGVMAVAAIQAAEAGHILAGRKPALAGKLLLMDLADMSFETVDLG